MSPPKKNPSPTIGLITDSSVLLRCGKFRPLSTHFLSGGKDTRKKDENKVNNDNDKYTVHFFPMCKFTAFITGFGDIVNVFIPYIK